MSSVLPVPDLVDEAERVAAAFDWHVSELVAVYVHGSAALGGFGPASDLDVLVVVRELTSVDVLAEELLSLPLSHPLELSVVRAADALKPASPWPYLLHVNVNDGRWQVDDGQGDPDLISHYVVTRARGLTLRGLPPAETLGEVPAHVHRAHLATELTWAVTHADARYAVLNATRACAWLQSGLILSKIEGGALVAENTWPEFRRVGCTPSADRWTGSGAVRLVTGVLRRGGSSVAHRCSFGRLTAPAS